MATQIIGNLIDFSWDYVGVTTPTATTEVYTFRKTSSNGTQQATITVTYTDSSKSQLSSVLRVKS